MVHSSGGWRWTLSALTVMMEGNTIPADVTAPRIVDLINNTMWEKDGGEFVCVVGGERLPW